MTASMGKTVAEMFGLPPDWHVSMAPQGTEEWLKAWYLVWGADTIVKMTWLPEAPARDTPSTSSGSLPPFTVRKP